MPHDERTKRRKTFPLADSDSGASDDEAAYQKFLKGKGEGKLKPGNSNWNTCHMELRKTLEQAGTLDRYGIKHLCLYKMEHCEDATKNLTGQSIFMWFM